MDVVLINLLAAELITVPHEDDAEASSIQCLKVYMSIQQPHVELSVGREYPIWLRLLRENL